MAGLAAAWRLTEPGWQQRFESVTVIEGATRLGGKGASTRGIHGRVEEHGLHVWLGHYDNAFRLVRQCYAELDRARTDPGCPIRTWTDAFFPANDLGLFDRDADGWTPWVATFSGNDARPGDPNVDNRMPTVAELLVRAGLLVRDFYASFGPAASVAGATATASWSPRRAPSPALLETLKAASHQLLVLADRGARSVGGPAAADTISATFDPLLRRLRPAADPRARRLHDLMDLVRTVVVGMAVDGMRDERAAYDAVNEVDFREWLTAHGARPSTLRSAIVRGQYDLVFSHEDGDPARPRFAAGWGAFLSWKLWFDYKGAIFWKMAAGMGDVVFAPLHQALVARGATISLDHRVVDVIPGRDGTGIAAIDLSVPSARDPDDPLVRVGGLPCYVDRAASTRRRMRRLAAGDDFDLAVLAIPPAAAAACCAGLIAQKPAWQRLGDGLGSVPTQAFQVWLRPDERTLGWARPGTTMSAFAKPFDTWASMSHLIGIESWPDEVRPSTVAYFCSTHPAANGSATDAAAATRRMAIDFLECESRHFWPGARDAATGGFDWRLLAGDDGATGPARFDAQYWTANTAPSDRYVQSLPGTDRHRLRPDESGYDNLVLAGDWTDCGINAGCIEAAAISGLQAANALLGRSRWDGISGVLLR
jgi:uncharacterized protein with NAD-binding domain and iron-sulfur cluster